jgi:large repetitive protein
MERAYIDCMLRILIASTFALLSLPAAAACPLSRFDGPPVYADGTILAVEDFNEDSRIDVLSGLYPESELHLNLGGPGGTFRRGPAIPILSQTDRVPVAFDAATADFNRDGRLDFALAAQSTGAIEIHLGRGNGTFEPVRTVNYQREPRAIVTADFDGDGHLDLAVADFWNDVELFWGNGDATFSRPMRLPVSARLTDLVTDDFNNDGRPDLLIARVDGTMEVRLAVAGRTFVPIHVLRGGAYGIAVRDLDGDGRLDVTTADNSEFVVSIFRGQGDGTFRPRVNYNGGDIPEGIAFGEMTGDGIVDIVAGNSVDGSVAILPGVGNGAFGAPIVYSAGYNIWGVFVADVDGDGLDDILASDQASYTVLLQRPDHSFEERDVYRPASVVYDVAAADFDSDEVPDLAVAAFERAGAAMFLGNGDGTLRSAGIVPLGDDPIALDAVDLNGDGTADLVAGIRGGVSVALGRGEGRFADPVKTPLADIRYVTAVGDYDNDGDPDVLALDRRANTIRLLANDGAGRLWNGGELQASHAPTHALLVDVNGDGDTDLLTTEDTFINQHSAPGFLVIRLGNGNGSFGTPREHQVGKEPLHVSAADFDGDGDLDLAVSDFAWPDGAVHLFRGTGKGAFEPAGVLRGYGQAGEAVVRDLDADGDADVAFPNAGLVYVYENLGGFTFANPLAHIAGRTPMSLAAADFNGDGRIDLASSGLFGEVTVQRNSVCRRRSARH